MLTDNIMFLRENYPLLLDNIRDTRENSKENIVEIEDTRNGQKTLKIKKNNSYIYLHSKYNPTREAEAIIDKVEEREDIKEDSHIIFYGVGLGYHIDIFTKRHPNIKFSLYEPSVEVFNLFLENRNLKRLGIKNIDSINCEYDKGVRQIFLNQMITKIDEKIIIMDLPIYEKAFKEERKGFLDSFGELVKDKSSSLHVNYAFQERWIINSVANFREVLNTPNILMQDKNLFKDKIAILVAAGPSLELEIENLRKIKEKGLAYIFSVGSAINTLIHHDILPHAVCSYDPTNPDNIKVYKKMNDKQINNVPMCFGSSIAFEILEQFKGPKYHMITSQDTVSSYFLKDIENKVIDTVNDAPSIAVITLQMLYKLCFKTIVLVGQNLAYLGEKDYASGIEYYEDNKVDLENSILIKDVLGNNIYTNQSFNRMRLQMEMYIDAFKDIKIINTTKNGANIKGTEYVELDELLEKSLNTVNVDDFPNVIVSNNYDKEYLSEKTILFTKEYDMYKIQLKDLIYHMNKIKQLIKNNNLNQLDNMYIKLDQKTEKLNNNDFFKVIVRPMQRVICDILSTKVTSSKYNKNPISRGNEIVEAFEMFLNSLLLSQKDFENIYLLLMDRIGKRESKVNE